MRKSFYDIIKGRDKKENKRKKNEFLPRTKNVILKQGMDEEGRPAYYRQSGSPNYPARRVSDEAAGRDRHGKAESKETASNRQKKKEDPIYTLSKLAEMKSGMNKSYGPGHPDYKNTGSSRDTTPLSSGPGNKRKRKTWRNNKYLRGTAGVGNKDYETARNQSGRSVVASESIRGQETRKPGGYTKQQMGGGAYTPSGMRGGNEHKIDINKPRLLQTRAVHGKISHFDKFDPENPQVKNVKQFTSGPSEKGKSFFGKSFDITKGLTSRSFPQIGFVNRAYNPNMVFDNATRVVSTPARASESFNISPVAQDPMFKSCMAHNRQYDVRKGCLQCSVEKSNSCGKCGGQLNKSMQYGAICTNCTPVK